ncbi:hypothetical protein BT96DRAFT_885841 [Gymnopus androsaceus JB14]|uniref:Glycopeptide n=1 Tax=Gymnopus androsaceus JB14 TaxID=1447944 RepID=A0A6A4HAW1_9AGAR|nr:hypothetical protein BT96DRAFT_885841 [Gymnopus androsaceus JB14]
MQFTVSSKFAVISSLVALVAAESHTISFTNLCGGGTPTLVSQNGAILSTGGAYTADGPIVGALAYLQTGGCGLNGDFCTTVETTLINGGSATDITLVPDHEFSVTSGFGYYNGCDGTGLDCQEPDCPGAFTDSTNGWIISCATDNVDLAITFCD